MHAAYQLDLVHGQSENILEKIEQHQLHPTMAGFGLWRDNSILATLDEAITKDQA
jgi:hypothetical protein